MTRLTSIFVASFGAICALGASAELTANFVPQLLPAVVQQGLDASLYGTLHGDTVVKWWTRLSNIGNLLAGLGLVWVGAKLPNASAVRLGRWLFGWFIVSALAGAVVVAGWVFPLLDVQQDFPVDVAIMKASMLGAPAGLTMMAGLLIVAISRTRGAHANQTR